MAPRHVEHTDYTSRQMWSAMYSYVLDNGRYTSPREKLTCEVTDVTFVVQPHQHLNESVERNLSLDYLRREFLWYCNAEDRDTRIKEYAPIWKTCVGHDGRIPSCYGAHIYKAEIGEIYGPFWRALQILQLDNDSRRAWVPIIQDEHIQTRTGDIPCHTGFGFRIVEGTLEMTVHHRSLDMWWGAAFDFPIAYLWQLQAIAFLQLNLKPGPITHFINSAHFYSRHFDGARKAIKSTFTTRDHKKANEFLRGGFNMDDLEILNKERVYDPYCTSNSLLLHWLMDIPGAYGRADYVWG